MIGLLVCLSAFLAIMGLMLSDILRWRHARRLAKEVYDDSFGAAPCGRHRPEDRGQDGRCTICIAYLVTHIDGGI